MYIYQNFKSYLNLQGALFIMRMALSEYQCVAAVKKATTLLGPVSQPFTRPRSVVITPNPPTIAKLGIP